MTSNRTPKKLPSSFARGAFSSGRFSARELRQHFLFIEADEALLIWPDLMHIDVIKTRFDELVYLLYVLLRVGAAYDYFGDVIFGHHLRRLLKEGGRAQLLRK